MTGEDRSLTASEVALMDALKLVFEVFVAKGISKPETLSEALRRQAEQYPKDDMPEAIWVVQQIRDALDSPERKAHREFLARPAEGHG